jgi:hypothetical protein
VINAAIRSRIMQASPLDYRPHVSSMVNMQSRFETGLSNRRTGGQLSQSRWRDEEIILDFNGGLTLHNHHSGDLKSYDFPFCITILSGRQTFTSTDINEPSASLLVKEETLRNHNISTKMVISVISRTCDCDAESVSSSCQFHRENTARWNNCVSDIELDVES